MLKDNIDQSTNPWKTIWLDPRGTINHITSTNPQKYLLLLIVIGGLANTISYISATNLGDQYTLKELLAVAAFVGPVSGVLAIYLGGWLITLVTRRLGGIAGIAENRAALAWSWAPVVYLSPMWGVRYILFRQELFTLQKAFIEAHDFFDTLWRFYGVYDFVISMWCLYIMFSALSEVNLFSIWKSIAAYLVMSLIFLLPLLLMLMFVGPA